MAARRILIGVVGRPHGVRGLVHVTSHADDPTALAAYGPLEDERGRRWTLAWRGGGIAELSDEAGRKIADRTAATALVNLRLYADRERLPAPAPEEFYLADLIGLAAVDAAGAALGKVAQVHDYGAGASLEIERAGGAPLLVPFTRDAVPDVDLKSGCVVVVPPHVVVAGHAEASSGEAAA